jgi:hypothetical protein
MANLVELLENNLAVANETVNVYLKVVDSEVLIDASFETSEFSGGLKEFATVVNRITKPFKDATKNKCYLLITIGEGEAKKELDFIFFAGKFAPKMNTIIDAIAQSSRIFSTDKTKLRALKLQVVEYFNTNIKGFMNTLEFIEFIENTPLDALYIATKKANITLIDATNETK